MKEFSKTAVSKINFKSKLYYLVLTLFGAVFLLSCFMIGKQMLSSAKNERVYSSIQDEYYNHTEGLDLVEENMQQQREDNLLQEKDLPVTQTDILPRFNSLLEQNDATVGWIRVSGTEIDYPIVQGQDNDYYLNRTFEKDKNKAGSIFMDFRNDNESLDQNTIVYGHHMKDGSMFTKLKEFRDEGFASENKIITFDTLYDEMKWEVFAVFVTDTNFNYIQPNFSSEADFQDFIETVKSKSVIPVENEITQEDHILTLSTCGYDFDDARIVVQAKLLEH